MVKGQAPRETTFLVGAFGVGPFLTHFMVVLHGKALKTLID